jgi:hypothetical protein
MHASMSGYYEIRVTGPGRRHYRLFCLLDSGSQEELEARGFQEPKIAVINGMVKTHMTEFTDGEYRKHVRNLGDDYLSKAPRPIAVEARADQPRRDP